MHSVRVLRRSLNKNKAVSRDETDRRDDRFAFRKALDERCPVYFDDSARLEFERTADAPRAPFVVLRCIRPRSTLEFNYSARNFLPRLRNFSFFS